ncbi:MAG TPA: hypothetical protein VGN86_02885 [Pyrinomonadaceae bacterium]|jgi:hypothetical protein|nr:hypothetical protein [Pyrinomonadaceae bacterium]
MTTPEIFDDQTDFSLVLGGPLFQLMRRAHLSGNGLELSRRRTIAIASLAWLPLMVLSVIDGQAFSGGSKIPFLYDIESHIRFLIALPILIAAEPIVHARIRPAVKKFVQRRIVLPEEIPKFHAIIDSAMRLRNSIAIEVGLLILVYTLGLWVWRSQVASGTTSWYATSDGAHLYLTLAGYWYVFVSIPAFQFVLLRWYFRFFIWSQFLWRVAKLNLRLIATHPDRAAGLGFLGGSSYAFGPILFAQGALLSALIANRVLYEGQDLMSFKREAVGLIVFFLSIVLTPLFVFTPSLARAKRQGLHDYGQLASCYVHEFASKWIEGGASDKEQLLGNDDIQSLADLGNSFAVVQETRIVPFNLKDMARLAAATAAPLVPLGLLIFSVEELVTQLAKILM